MSGHVLDGIVSPMVVASGKAVKASRRLESSFFWVALPTATFHDEMLRIADEAEPRRATADYQTGSIIHLEACLLRAIAERLQARTVIEVGTFIGASTHALASAPSVERVYTCDSSNDCLPSTEKIVTFPKQTSTDMLKALWKRGVSADLCFFDGALSAEDVDLLAHVCRNNTAFVVHDHNFGPKLQKHGGIKNVARKGIGNVNLLKVRWPDHRLVEPLPQTTMAAFVPEGLL